jgi:hypothetical protein
LRSPRLAILRKILIVLIALSVLEGCKLWQIPNWTRKEYLQKGKVWHKTDIPTMDIMAGPHSEISVRPEQEVTCRFVEPKTRSKGFSPKFKCKLNDGPTVRVKYSSRETYSEIAATRLLWALGFYTDEVYPVKLKCLGCPAKNPSHPAKDEPRIEIVFEDAIIEHNFSGEEIGEFRDEGWKWAELDQVEAKFGGSSRAEVDALKLIAVFLQHSDSKPPQQRLACFPNDLSHYLWHQTCQQSVLMVQDVGATFGMSAPKVEAFSSMYLRGWENEPIWKTELEEEKGNCVGNVVPSRGGDLRHPEISEAGRKFLSDLLNQLTDQQIANLFIVARAERTDETLLEQGREREVTIDDWVQVFKKKRQEINDHHCI